MIDSNDAVALSLLRRQEMNNQLQNQVAVEDSRRRHSQPTHSFIGRPPIVQDAPSPPPPTAAPPDPHHLDSHNLVAVKPKGHGPYLQPHHLQIQPGNLPFLLLAAALVAVSVA